VIRQLIIGSYFLDAVIAGALVWLWRNLPPKIPWLYSLPWGEEQLVDKLWWVIGMGIWVVIFFLMRRLIRWAAKDDDQVEIVLTWALVIINGLFVAGVYKVLRLVVMI